MLSSVLTLIGGWTWAQVKDGDPPWEWQLAVDVAIFLLSFSLVLCAWRGRITRREERNGQRGEDSESERTMEEETEGAGRLSFSSPPDPVEWVAEEDEEEEEEENGLTLLVLQDFYASQVYKGRRDPPHDHCDLVKGLVDAMLRHVRRFGPCCAEVLRGGCVGAGSMFEGWGLNRGGQVPVYDVLVILNPPVGFSLDVELGEDERTLRGRPSDSTADSINPSDPSVSTPSSATDRSPQTSKLLTPESTPPSENPRRSGLPALLGPPDSRPGEQCGTARVFVRQTGPGQRRVHSFCSRTRLADFVERARVEHIKEGLEYMLEECLMLDQYMEPVRALSWLGAAMRRGWQSRGGGLKVTFWGREWPCVIRVETGQGRALYVNAVPAVRVPDSDTVVAARGRVAPPWQGVWEPWFCSDEGYFLRKLAAGLPGDSCHTLCLEILAYLNRPPAAFSSRAVAFLSSYHLKTLLLHYLLRRPEPQAWDGVYLAERLADVLVALRCSLRERRLLSFWVANPALGDLQPEPFRRRPPLNLFALLAEHEGWYGLALAEHRRLRARLKELPRRLSYGLGRLAPPETFGTKRAPSGNAGTGKPDFKRHRAVKKVVTRTLSRGGERVPPLVDRGRSGSALHESRWPLFRFFPTSPWRNLLKAVGLEEGHGVGEDSC